MPGSGSVPHDKSATGGEVWGGPRTISREIGSAKGPLRWRRGDRVAEAARLGLPEPPRLQAVPVGERLDSRQAFVSSPEGLCSRNLVSQDFAFS